MSTETPAPGQEVPRYHFRWISSFLNIDHYEVVGDGPAYRIETRRETTPAQDAYQRTIFTGTDDQWQRDVVGATNLLHRVHDIHEPLPPALVDAFNAWRARDYAEQLGELLSRLTRDANFDPADPIWKSPPIVRGAHYVVGRGWVASDSKETPCTVTPQRGTQERVSSAGDIPPRHYRAEDYLRPFDYTVHDQRVTAAD
jgi:hypothetical protein